MKARLRKDLSRERAQRPQPARAELVWGLALKKLTSNAEDVARALVRDPEGQSTTSVLLHVNDENLYRFDQACQVKAINVAGRRLGRDPLHFSIAILPNAVHEPAT